MLFDGMAVLMAVSIGAGKGVNLIVGGMRG